ncbi:hypothetical protein Bbelb_172730 [Branchiostoma belcheri]|nr:hypothetical protein Bbelb_172730 [Branchiostoma belcheri]
MKSPSGPPARSRSQAHNEGKPKHAFIVTAVPERRTCQEIHLAMEHGKEPESLRRKHSSCGLEQMKMKSSISQCLHNESSTMRSQAPAVNYCRPYYASIAVEFL